MPPFITWSQNVPSGTMEIPADASPAFPSLLIFNPLAVTIAVFLTLVRRIPHGAFEAQHAGGARLISRRSRRSPCYCEGLLNGTSTSSSKPSPLEPSPRPVCLRTLSHV